MCSSESLFELMLRVLTVFDRRDGMESREQEDKSNNSMLGPHLGKGMVTGEEEELAIYLRSQ